jgi:hypothetical protein
LEFASERWLNGKDEGMADTPQLKDLIGLYPEERCFYVNACTFSRRVDGSVYVTIKGESLLLDPASWCSLVAEMSFAGGNSETYAAALAAHLERYPKGTKRVSGSTERMKEGRC